MHQVKYKLNSEYLDNFTTPVSVAEQFGVEIGTHKALVDMYIK